MLTRRALFVLRLRGFVPSTVRGWALAVLWVVFVASVAALAVAPSAVGEWVALGVNVGVLALDPAAFWMLGGILPPWRRLGTAGRVGVVVLFMLAWPVPLVRLIQLTRAANVERQHRIADAPAHIRQLERDLGMNRPQEP